MKRLLDTQLLKLLNTKGTFNTVDTDITPIYDDFAHSTVFICTATQGEASAYFTRNYTRLKLEAFQSKLSTESRGNPKRNLKNNAKQVYFEMRIAPLLF